MAKPIDIGRGQQVARHAARRRPKWVTGRGFGVCDRRLRKLPTAALLAVTAAQEHHMNFETPPARRAARSQCFCRLARAQQC